MRITCPNCAAAYDVPDTLLAGAPRAVRCARCATVWRPADAAPPALVPAPAASFAPATAHPGLGPSAPAADDMRWSVTADGRPRLVREFDTERRVGRALLLGWLLSLTVLGVLLWSGWHFRAAVKQAWPPSIRLYAAIESAIGLEHQ